MVCCPGDGDAVAGDSGGWCDGDRHLEAEGPVTGVTSGAAV